VQTVTRHRRSISYQSWCSRKQLPPPHRLSRQMAQIVSLQTIGHDHIEKARGPRVALQHASDRPNVNMIANVLREAHTKDCKTNLLNDSTSYGSINSPGKMSPSYKSRWSTLSNALRTSKRAQKRGSPRSLHFSILKEVVCTNSPAWRPGLNPKYCQGIELSIAG